MNEGAGGSSSQLREKIMCGGVCMHNFVRIHTRIYVNVYIMYMVLMRDIANWFLYLQREKCREKRVLCCCVCCV